MSAGQPHSFCHGWSDTIVYLHLRFLNPPHLFCLLVKELYGTRYQSGLLFLNFMWGVVFTACVGFLFLFFVITTCLHFILQTLWAHCALNICSAGWRETHGSHFGPICLLFLYWCREGVFCCLRSFSFFSWRECGWGRAGQGRAGQGKQDMMCMLPGACHAQSVAAAIL